MVDCHICGDSFKNKRAVRCHIGKIHHTVNVSKEFPTLRDSIQHKKELNPIDHDSISTHRGMSLSPSTISSPTIKNKITKYSLEKDHTKIFPGVSINIHPDNINAPNDNLTSHKNNIGVKSGSLEFNEIIYEELEVFDSAKSIETFTQTTERSKSCNTSDKEQKSQLYSVLICNEYRGINNKKSSPLSDTRNEIFISEENIEVPKQKELNTTFLNDTKPRNISSISNLPTKPQDTIYNKAFDKIKNTAMKTSKEIKEASVVYPNNTSKLSNLGNEDRNTKIKTQYEVTNNIKKAKFQKKMEYLDHREDKINDKFNYMIICRFCNLQVLSNKTLIKHYNSAHGTNIKIKKVYFKNIELFDIWKENNFKTETHTMILKTRNNNDGDIEYYKCNYRCNKRRQCSAFATCNKYSNNTIKVSFSFYHTHPTNWDQVSLPTTIKDDIIKEIETGVPLYRIYINLLSQIDDKIETKSQTLSMGYLHYLKKKCNEKITMSKNDYNSLLKIIEKETEYTESNKCIIKICLKKLGKAIPEYNIKSDDFIFSFTTPKLLDKFNEYSGKGVLFDSTHSTNLYAYPLICGMVVTDNFSAFPFIYIIASNEREETLHYVFEEFKKLIDEIRPVNYFVSDMYTGFFNGWNKTFDYDIDHIFCDFHVKKSWKKNINKLVKDEKTRKIIVEYFDIFSRTTCKDKFELALESFMKTIEKLNERFFIYFKTFYYSNKEKWALPYRLKCYFNTNNYCESFFKKLKYKFLDNITNSRVDLLCVKLFKTSYILINEHAVRSASGKKGNQTFRVTQSIKNHKTSLDIDKELITTIDSINFEYNGYKISWSQQFEEIVHSKILCPYCLFHFQEFTCTCLNFTKVKQMCKHIHAVASKYFQTRFMSRAYSNFGHVYDNTELKERKDSEIGTITVSEVPKSKRIKDRTPIIVESIESTNQISHAVSNSELENMISSLSKISLHCTGFSNSMRLILP